MRGGCAEALDAIPDHRRRLELILDVEIREASDAIQQPIPVYIIGADPRERDGDVAATVSGPARVRAAAPPSVEPLVQPTLA